VSQLQETRAIRALIDTYTRGCQTGDLASLKEIFHADAKMYGSVDGRRGEQPVTRMFEILAATPTGDSHQCEIVSIQQTGDAASVLFIEENFLGRSYMDHFALTRHDGKWLVVSKVYQQIA
jgi:uncharacterized protein (TIGR02246 family)